MKKNLLLVSQFIILSFLTFGEIFLFYTTILMNTYTEVTTWLGIVIVSLFIAVINIGILLILNKYLKLKLNTGIVYFLSAVAASGLCFISGLLFDEHSIMDNIDFNKEIDYFTLFFFSLWPIMWSAIISFTVKKIKA